MESRFFLQPMLRCVARSSCSTAPRIPVAPAPAVTAGVTATATSASRRHQSTTSRTKRALKVAPHPSFLGGERSADSGGRVVYNPPSSSASVYHTPFKFLPPSDPRRQANLTQMLRTSSDLTPATSPSSSELGPELASHPKLYNVTREQVDEMRRLREEDPETWSVHRLAARYGCAPFFIIMCVRSSPEHRDRARARLDAVKARWGPIRTAAREERKKRKALVLKDAL
ncbi:mitochondrial ribosomal protein subunit L20-domain-containing protein [Hypoxylon sp. FL1284]|nr:mitochondrial ribosomal protein subunit L20-domain-containing protein [Hypoxylon sp. FL1284]